ncbi:ATP-binding protein [Streptomyces sp. R39]|uniref:ATP-binding protein n=1 Tax=Streptomyces sp. R39 TaxID=3238631 RepID=A0AB39QJ55_9ACTN
MTNSKDLAREIVEGTGTEVEKGRGPSQASQITALARERYELFMSEDGRPYGVKVDGANIALPLRGKAGLRSQLARIYTDAHDGSVPAQSALTDAMVVLEGVAQAADPRQPHVRVARGDGVLVVDLGDADGQCIVIGPDGWRREQRSPVLFRRSGAMKPLPLPLRDGDGLAKLRALLNTDEDGFRLLVAWLVAAFIPDLPHPVLTFRGEQGTGKSYSAKMVIGLVDPSGAPKRTAPRDIKSWATQAFNSWALCLDNVSIIPDWLSDALCRAVTGDGIVDRALYTDDDVVVLEFRRVLAMTTIDAGALAGDLAERLLTIELHTIPDRARREEAELDAAYSDAHAGILASLFDLLADVLRVLPDVQLTERPRMADFARVLAAVDKVKGWDTLESYKATARDAVADVLDGEPFAQAVVALVDRAGPGGIVLTASELLERVPAPDRLPKKWPKDPTRAGGQLKRLAPALRTIGIDVDDSKRGPKPKKQRLYHLTASADRRCETASPASPYDPETDSDQQEEGGRYRGDASGPPATRGDAGNARGDAALFVASPQDTGPDQHGYSRGDAGDAGDAEMHPLSVPAPRTHRTPGQDAEDAPQDARPTTPCARCSRAQWNAEGSPLCLDCRTAA